MRSLQYPLMRPSFICRSARLVLALAIPFATLTACPAQSNKPPATTQDKVEAAMKSADASDAAGEPQAPAAVADDPASQHNLRMAAFSSLYESAVRAYERAHGTMPPDLESFIGAGFLWLLPDVPRPATYTFIENIGSESDPLWPQVSFVLLPEYAAIGFFNMAPDQPLENPAGVPPQISVQITPGMNPRQSTLETKDPLPADWETYLKDETITPQRRLEVLRRRSGDPVEVLAIHLFDTLEVLPDRFTNTTGRLPANFNDLLTGNWATTAQFKRLQEAAAIETDPAARLYFHFVPSRRAFVWELQLFTRDGLMISDKRALAMDMDSPGPRRSALLLVVDPATIDMADAVLLSELAFPRSLTGLPQGSESIQDQAETAQN